jgi:type VI protein secretion system component Hcp
MKYGSGADITGDVQLDNYKGFIALNSFYWASGRGIDNTNSSDADRENTVPSVREFVVTKDNDSSSDKLMRAAQGVGDKSKGKDVEIHFVRTGTSGPQDYLVITLHECLVSGWSYSDSRSCNPHPVETVTLNFTGLEYVAYQDPTLGDLSTGDKDTARYPMRHRLVWVNDRWVSDGSQGATGERRG